MTQDEQRFLSVLVSLTAKSSVGVGLFLPLAKEVNSLIQYGYCESKPMLNPHKLSGTPDVIVSLTEEGRAAIMGGHEGN